MATSMCMSGLDVALPVASCGPVRVPCSHRPQLHWAKLHDKTTTGPVCTISSIGLKSKLVT